MALLDKTKLNADFEPALTAMKPWWDNFDEYERIARNKPHPKVIAAKLPTVTDGTLAGVIARQPKRIIQQIPTGRVKVPQMPEIAPVVDYMWQHQIVPNANYNGDMLQKSWIMARKALTYGAQCSYTFFKNKGDYFGADFSIPYIKDVILERGQSYGPDCNIIYVRQWYTESQINQIIDKEKRLSRSAKRRKDEYVGVWDIPNLRKAIKEAKAKASDAQTPAEREKATNAALIEIIHAFQTGVGAEFYSFCPDIDDGKNIVRTRTNRDPRGKIPIDWLYADIDLSNPLGVGYPEMSGGMQNLLDSEVQSFQLIQKLMLNPPVMKWGKGIKGSTIKYRNNAVWDMGNDPNSKIEVVNISNEAIANFANNYGLMKSQILALTSNQDSTVPAQATGGVGPSKTPAGVNQTNQIVGFDDNYFRKQYETWLQDVGETLLNVHCAEAQGDREIELDQDFIDDVFESLKGNKVVKIDKKKQIATVDYTALDDLKIRFEVDPTSSESDNDSEQIQVLKDILGDIAANPSILDWMDADGYEFHPGEAYNDLFQRLGSSNIAKIITKKPRDDTNGQGGNAQSAANATAQQTVNGQPVDPSTGQPVDPNAPAQPPQAPAGVPAGPPSAVLQPQGQPTPTGAEKKPPSESLSFKDVAAASPLAGAAMLAQAELPPDELLAQAKDNAANPAVPSQPNAPATNPNTHPPAAQGPSGAMTAIDKQLAGSFLKAGYSPQQALDAITLANQGMSHDEILQTIGQPAGGSQPQPAVIGA